MLRFILGRKIGGTHVIDKDPINAPIKPKGKNKQD